MTKEAPIHVATALLSAVLEHQPPRIDYGSQPAGILIKAMHRAVDDLESQGPRSERIALQLLEALARFEFEEMLEGALRSDLALAPYEEDNMPETEELPAEMMRKLAEKRDPQRDPAQAGNSIIARLAEKPEAPGVTSMHLGQAEHELAEMDKPARDILTRNMRAGKGKL
jgi:hypothetical protein